MRSRLRSIMPRKVAMEARNGRLCRDDVANTYDEYLYQGVLAVIECKLKLRISPSL